MLLYNEADPTSCWCMSPCWFLSASVRSRFFVRRICSLTTEVQGTSRLASKGAIARRSMPVLLVWRAMAFISVWELLALGVAGVINGLMTEGCTSLCFAHIQKF